MGRSSLRPLADRLLDGDLASWLQTRRDDGDSYDAIARDLATEHDIHISNETVRTWCRELGIEAS